MRQLSKLDKLRHRFLRGELGLRILVGIGQLYARHHALFVVGFSLLSLLGCVTVGLVLGIPLPDSHDEHSYLLGADTFAHGRFANPSLPCWEAFETFHVLVHPTYASKYPPGLALVLAFGQATFGHPIVGAWLAAAGLGAAMAWGLRFWLRPHWAVLLSGLVVARFGFVGEWSQTYWGGAWCACGGALAFGAFGALRRRATLTRAAALGLGVAILALTRPYEGALAAIPLGLFFVVWWLGHRSHRLMLGVLLPLFGAAALWVAYDIRVTGDALKMPYVLYNEQYAIVPTFLWQDPPAQPEYNHDRMRRFYESFEKPQYDEKRAFGPWLRSIGGRVSRLTRHIYGTLSILPLLGVLLLVRDRRARALVVPVVSVLAGLSVYWGYGTHYSAPILIALMVALACFVRSAYGLRLRRFRLGDAMLVVAMGAMLFDLPHELRHHAKAFRDNPSWFRHKDSIRRELVEGGGQHLVFVDYDGAYPINAEWVYNGADLDGASVIWARHREEALDAALLAQYQERRTWLLDAHGDDANVRPTVRPYAPKDDEGLPGCAVRPR